MRGSSWFVCQIGARENFGVARALARKGALAELVTDVWCGPGHPLRMALGRIGERTHPELPSSLVWAHTGRAVLRELADRRAGRTGWRQIMHRNAWFQRMAVRRLKRLRPDGRVILFAYSYAAAEILALAKARGWTTVLGQVDPGPVEARLVDRLYEDAGQADVHASIPAEYWTNWQRETALADVIVVNSEWSRQGLLAEGVPAEKIAVLPLALEATLSPRPRSTPARFDAERPLRLLFLGQVTLRKGIDLALEAMRRRPDAPLRLDVVGPLQIAIPDWAGRDPRIIFHRGVSRSAVAEFYAQADLFLFPTRSDGFGLTQLEALSAGVPVIASDRCGAVVEDGRTGVVVRDLDAESFACVLERFVRDPARLAALRGSARLDPRFDLDTLGERLLALGRKLDASDRMSSR